MTQSDNPELVPQSGVTDSDEPKTSAKAQKLKFYAVVAAMVLLCGGFIWLIFAPDEGAQPEGASGLNTTVPEATVQTTQDDKRKAYEDEQYRQRQQEKLRTLQEVGESLMLPAAKTQKKPQSDPIRTSQEAYKRVNRQVSTFYQTPKEDPQVAELRRQLTELTARLDGQDKAPDPAVDPLAMMEKSYELAAKYYPQGGTPGPKSVPVASSAPDREPAVAVRRAADETTSTLSEPAPLTLEERNYAFNTAVGDSPEIPAGAIRACVAEDQVLTMGARVKLRLQESLQAGD